MRAALLRAVASAALMVALLAGCGGTQAPSAPAKALATSAAPTTTPEPTPSASARVSPTPAPAAKPGAVTLLPWPTSNQARLQSAVDSGATPWLLDPTDLALSYVTATYNWMAADASPAAGTPAATKVDVRNTDGRRRTLTVAQPGRKGNGGIWVVTADTAA